jgi:hypothetical protein
MAKRFNKVKGRENKIVLYPDVADSFRKISTLLLENTNEILFLLSGKFTESKMPGASTNLRPTNFLFRYY